MVNLTPYREQIHCDNCEKLQQELDKLKGNILRPYQIPSDAKCINCNFTLFRGSKISGWSPNSWKDLKYCNGKGWFKKSCPQFEHIHRHCGACGGNWLEYTLDNTPEVK